MGRTEYLFAGDDSGKGPAGYDFVDHPVFFGLVTRHVEITIGVPLNLIRLSSGVLHQNAIQFFAQSEDFPGLDVHIGCLTLEAAHGLVEHDTHVGEGITFPFTPAARSTAAMLAACPCTGWTHSA